MKSAKEIEEKFKKEWEYIFIKDTLIGDIGEEITQNLELAESVEDIDFETYGKLIEETERIYLEAIEILEKEKEKENCFCDDKLYKINKKIKDHKEFIENIFGVDKSEK